MLKVHLLLSLDGSIHTGRTILWYSKHLCWNKREVQFSARIPPLKKVSLTSYTNCGSDLYYPLQYLTVRKQIEELSIHTNRETAIPLLPNHSCRHLAKHLPNFTNLKSVEFLIEGNGGFDFDAEFVRGFASKLSNVEEIRVNFQYFIHGINKIIDMAPKVSV